MLCQAQSQAEVGRKLTDSSGNGSRNGGGLPPVRPATIRAAHTLPDIGSSRDLLSRHQFASAHGWTYGGRRNLSEALGYEPTLAVADYRARYRRGGIAKKILEAFPRATWAQGTSIYEEEDPEVITPFEEQTEALFARLEIWDKLLRADILAGLGRYSVLLIGTAAASSLDTELPRGNADSLIYLTPYAEDRAKVEKLVEDERDPRFGLPLTYRINMGKKSSGATIDPLVHWTRVIHIAEGTLDDEIYGAPRLEPVWNLLNDLDKIVGGGAEAAWRRMDPGNQVDIPLFGPDGQQLEAVDVSEVEDQMEEYRHGLRRDLYTRGIKINPLSATVAAFGGNADAVLQLIAGTLSYPKRIFVGSERGELASSQDDDNWNDRITERRTAFGKPRALAPLLNRLIDFRYLPTPKQWEVWWPEKDELSEAEKATVAVSMASANASQHTAEGIVILTSAEIREQVYGLEPLDEPEDDTDVNDDATDLGDVDVDNDDDDGTELSVNARMRAGEYDLADTPSDDPEWRAIHRAADSHIPTMACLFRGLWQDAADELDGPEIEEYLSRGAAYSVYSRIDAALREAEGRLLGASGAASGVLSGRLLSVLTDGALASLRSARARGGWRAAVSALDKSPSSAVYSSPLDQVPTLGTASLDTSESRPHAVQFGAVAASIRGATSLARWPDPGELPPASSQEEAHDYQNGQWSQPATFHSARFSASFDATNPRAVSFADTRSATLVTQIGTDTRAALRELVAVGLRDGIAPAKLRQYIRQSVGLRTDQLLAVSNLRARLAAAKPGATVRAGKVRIKIPKSGASSRFIDDKAAKYASKLLNDRAILIARTETLRSANAGQLELWKQAQEGGTLPSDAQRYWIETPDSRLRHSHAIMAGQKVGINEPFDPPIEPGEEPACRCCQGIA